MHRHVTVKAIETEICLKKQTLYLPSNSTAPFYRRHEMPPPLANITENRQTRYRLYTRWLHLLCITKLRPATLFYSAPCVTIPHLPLLMPEFCMPLCGSVYCPITPNPLLQTPKWQPPLQRRNLSYYLRNLILLPKIRPISTS